MADRRHRSSQKELDGEDWEIGGVEGRTIGGQDERLCWLAVPNCTRVVSLSSTFQRLQSNDKKSGWNGGRIDSNFLARGIKSYQGWAGCFIETWRGARNDGTLSIKNKLQPFATSSV